MGTSNSEHKIDVAVRYELTTPDVVSDVLGDEVVIINLDSGMYFRAVGATALVWQAVIAGADGSSVPDDRRAEWTTFVSLLLGHGLIRQRSDTGTAGAYPTWAASELKLETHDDLKDLLALDPVHDVDTATGWPEQPTA